MPYNVIIHGPNLNDQSKGTFHVHAADCQDNKKYGPDKKFGGEDDGLPAEVANAIEIVEFIYDNQLSEQSDDPEVQKMYARDWLSDFHFAPCIKDLPNE